MMIKQQHAAIKANYQKIKDLSNLMA